MGGVISVLRIFSKRFAHQPGPVLTGKSTPRARMSDNNSTLSASAAEFVPSWMRSDKPADDTAGLPINSVVKNCLGEISSRSSLQSVMPRITGTVNNAFLDQPGMEELVTTVYEWCISSRNFTYYGARLCDHLSKNMTTGAASLTRPPSDIFRDLLLGHCRRDCDSRESLVTSDPERMRNLSFFIAELYACLDIVENNVATKCDELGAQLIDQLLVLVR